MPRKPVLTDLSHGPVVCSYKSKNVKLLAINRDPQCSRPYYVRDGDRRAWVSNVEYTDPVYDNPEDNECHCETCIVTARAADFIAQSLDPVDAANCLCRMVGSLVEQVPLLRPVMREAMREVLKRQP